MKKLFVIGGMGAGKSTVRKALTDQGLPFIDLDLVGHEILKWDAVKSDLKETFGGTSSAKTARWFARFLAAKAFQSPPTPASSTASPCPASRRCTPIALRSWRKRAARRSWSSTPCSKNRMSSLAYSADVVIAVLAPIEMRIERAVASGFDEGDVRRRIARQITDADRIEAADVVFNNDSTKRGAAQRGHRLVEQIPRDHLAGLGCFCAPSRDEPGFPHFGAPPDSMSRPRLRARFARLNGGASACVLDVSCVFRARPCDVPSRFRPARSFASPRRLPDVPLACVGRFPRPLAVVKNTSAEPLLSLGFGHGAPPRLVRS